MSELMSRRWEYFTTLIQEGKWTYQDATRSQLAILWASVSNTMPTTFWVLFYLLKNAICMDKVYLEIIHIIPSLANHGEQCMHAVDVTSEQLSQMIYLDACITEALRLCSGSLIMRSMHHACTITLPCSEKSYHFRKGDKFGLCPPVLHRDEDIYPNASSFHPDRWMLPSVDSKTGIEYALQDKINAAQGKMPMVKHGKEVPR
jgi:cytochrome P450